MFVFKVTLTNLVDELNVFSEKEEEIAKNLSKENKPPKKKKKKALHTVNNDVDSNQANGQTPLNKGEGCESNILDENELKKSTGLRDKTGQNPGFLKKGTDLFIYYNVYHVLSSYNNTNA